MDPSVFEHLGKQIDESAHHASHTVSAVEDVLEDGVIAAERAAKRGACAASEAFCDTKRCLQRHPFESIAATFAAGIAAGAAIVCIARKKRTEAK
jgi:ElaB/YqjD/DUF883 family membrane-anchored ribosome-binding protein